MRKYVCQSERCVSFCCYLLNKVGGSRQQIYYLFFFLAALSSLWDLSSPTRD